MDCVSVSIYEGQGRLKDICVGAHAHRWRALRRLCLGGLLNIPDLDM